MCLLLAFGTVFLLERKGFFFFFNIRVRFFGPNAETSPHIKRIQGKDVDVLLIELIKNDVEENPRMMPTAL